MVRVGSVWRACKERMGDMYSTEAFRGKYVQQSSKAIKQVCKYTHGSGGSGGGSGWWVVGGGSW